MNGFAIKNSRKKDDIETSRRAISQQAKTGEGMIDPRHAPHG
jgi:hypothetical protein